MTRTVSVTAVAAVALVAGVAAAPSPAGAPPASRAWRVHLTAPAQFDVTVARLRFPLPPRTRRLRFAARRAGPTGLHFVAVGRPVRQPRGGLVALMVVVNRRPRGSPARDVARIDLTTLLSRVARRPQVSEIVNLYRATAVPRPVRRALCSVPGSRTLGVRDLALVLRAGAPPPGFGARPTIVQAFQTACGRPVDRRFRGAVQGGLQPAPLPPSPPPADVSPCPCRPRPGVACPDVQPPPPCPSPAARPAAAATDPAHFRIPVRAARPRA